MHPQPSDTASAEEEDRLVHNAAPERRQVTEKRSFHTDEQLLRAAVLAREQQDLI